MNDQQKQRVKDIREKFNVHIVPDSDYLPATNGALIFNENDVFLFRMHGILSDTDNALDLIEEELRKEINE